MANLQLLLLSFLSSTLLASIASAASQYKVGGSGTWAVPSDPNAMSYNKWAEKNRFRIGDSVVFIYLPDKDSVLLVNEEAYRTCNTSSPIDEFNDGNTVFTFTRSGPFYFISGNRDNCLKNESLTLVVMSHRGNLAPAPSPAADLSSPPPPGIEVVSSPAGSESAPPPPNAASVKVVGFVGTVLGFLGSLFFIL